MRLDYKKENIEKYKRKDDSARPGWGKQWHKDSMDYLIELGPSSSVENILKKIEKNLGLIVGIASELGNVRPFSNELIGINISVDELQRVKKNYKKIELVACDAENLPFKDSIFGCIFCKSTLHHIDISSGLAEFKRITDKKGHLILVEPGSYNPIAAFGRKFFPTNIHVKSEKPFDPRLLRKTLVEYYGTIEVEHYFFLLTPILPILAKYFFPFRNKKFLHFCFLLENSVTTILLKKLCWYIIMDVIKSK